MTSQPLDATAAPNGDTSDEGEGGALEVFRNRPFLLLWLAQAFTQIGGNMVIYGLTVIILETTRSNTAVSFLILTFLGPAVLFSAVAGVYVDRLDKRVVLPQQRVAVRRPPAGPGEVADGGRPDDEHPAQVGRHRADAEG